MLLTLTRTATGFDVHLANEGAVWLGIIAGSLVAIAIIVALTAPLAALTKRKP